MRLLIGSNGTVGQSLLDTMSFDLAVNSDNLHTIKNREFSLVVVAAPSGNRLAINRGQIDDWAACQQIINVLSTVHSKKTVLIGSVDAVTAPDTPYGRARLWLEQNLPWSDERCVFRLATLIGRRIKKNLIFNLRHNLFLDTLDPGAELQWSILADLHRHINTAQPNANTAHNLVSCPIKNDLIIRSFRPDLAVDTIAHSTTRYDLQPYTYTENDVLTAIQEYML